VAHKIYRIIDRKFGYRPTANIIALFSITYAGHFRFLQRQKNFRCGDCLVSENRTLKNLGKVMENDDDLHPKARCKNLFPELKTRGFFFFFQEKMRPAIYANVQENANGIRAPLVNVSE